MAAIMQQICAQLLPQSSLLSPPPHPSLGRHHLSFLSTSNFTFFPSKLAQPPLISTKLKHMAPSYLSSQHPLPFHPSSSLTAVSSLTSSFISTSQQFTVFAHTSVIASVALPTTTLVSSPTSYNTINNPSYRLPLPHYLQNSLPFNKRLYHT